MSARDIIAQYIAHVPQVTQDTPEWHKARSDTIGGSEIRYVINGNYKNFIDMKTGKKPFFGNIHTRWGKLIEPVSRDFMEAITNEKIYEVGSVDGIVPRQRYSPDGIGAVKNDIVLYEFKNPTVTLPTGKIPTQYIPQVQSGLCSIGITDYALFVNSAYRRCPFKHANFTSEHVHDIHKERLIVDEAISVGVILFEITPIGIEKLSDEIYLEEYYNLLEYQDYGRNSRTAIDKILQAMDAGFVKAIYCPTIYNKKILSSIDEYDVSHLPDISEKRVNRMVKSCIENYDGNEERLAGFMCYKLLLVDILRIDKDEAFEGILRQHATAAIAALDEVLNQT